MKNLSTIKSSRHARLLQERDSFLCNHPELQYLQKTIDEKLRNACNDNNRLVIIHSLMMEAVAELDDKLQALVGNRR